MSIQSFISSAKKLYDMDAYNEALCLVCIAVDASAARKYPNLTVSERYKKFISDNFRVICIKGLPGISANSIRIKVITKIRNLKVDKNGYVDMSQIIYHVLRCGLVHTCQIEKTVIFTDNTIIGNWNQNGFYLPKTLILGLMDAVIASNK